MKRYQSINLIRAFACITVVVAHWKAFFASMGSPRIDSLVFEGPLVMLIYSSMGVSVFLMLSSCMAALKIYRGRQIHAGKEVLKRYIRLSIPIFVTSLIVYLLQKAGLIFTSEAGTLLGNDFIAGLYAEPLKLANLFKISFVTALFREENSFYVPFWMMSYIFLGSLVSMGIAFVVRSFLSDGNASGGDAPAAPAVSRNTPDIRVAAVFGFLFLAMSILDSYYLCITLGNLIALLLSESEKRGLWETGSLKNSEGLTNRGELKNSEAPKISGGLKNRRVLIAAAVVLLLFGMWFSTRAYVIAWNINAAGIGAPLNDSWYWQVLAGFCICIGFIWGWELLTARMRESQKDMPAPQNSRQKSSGLVRRAAKFKLRVIDRIGEISYEIFLTHWFLFCSFSCLFYVKTANRHMHVSILLNFVLTFLLILICSAVYHELISKRLSGWLLRILEKRTSNFNLF